MPPSPQFDDLILVSATRWVQGAGEAASQAFESRVENRHLGWLIVTDEHQNLLHCTPGAAETATFFRSSAKPFQAFPLLRQGFADALTAEELALACASHVATPRHQAIVASILAKAGCTEEDLQCGPHFPLDGETAQALQRSGMPPRKLHNNCSGKHAAMLLYCRKAGLPLTQYLDPAHPLQQAILSGIATWGGVRDIPLAVDGCGAPVPYLPLRAMALLYAHLAKNEAFAPLCAAMTRYPQLVGGEGRLDTVIMQVTRGALVVKMGADGVVCVGHRALGQGLALKLSDGSGEVRDLALVEILKRLGWLDTLALSDGRILPYLEKQNRRNTQDQIIGAYQVRFDPA